MKDTNTYNTLKYSLIAFPLAFAGIPIYLHAPDYYVTNIGIKIEIIGFALLLLRLVDAILDPLIGSLSDQLYKYRDKIFSVGLFINTWIWMIFSSVKYKYYFMVFFECISMYFGIRCCYKYPGFWWIMEYSSSTSYKNYYYKRSSWYIWFTCCFNSTISTLFNL